MKVNKSLLVGVSCSLGCALCAALFVWQVNAEAEGVRAEALAKYGGDQIEVCVATRDLSAGEVLDASDIETKMWIADLLPEDAITSRDEAIGKSLGSSIFKGEVLSEKRFAHVVSELDVPTGYAAVSVPVQEVQAIGGALVSGMKVDVYATGPSGTTCILESALVLSVGFADEGAFSSGDAGGVTLAVPPESVQEVVAAAQGLELYFVLPGEPLALEEEADSDAAIALDDLTESALSSEEAASEDDASADAADAPAGAEVVEDDGASSAAEGDDAA